MPVKNAAPAASAKKSPKPPAISLPRAPILVAQLLSDRELRVLQVVRVQELLLRPLDPLARPHDLDELLAALRRPDHDRPDQAVVLEEELAVKLLLEAVSAHGFEAGLHVWRHAHDRQRPPHHHRPPPRPI